MKVVHIAEWEQSTGGAFNVLINLISNFSEMETLIEIHVISFSDRNETLFKNGYTIHLIKYVDFPTARYWYLPKLLKQKIIEIDPDIIHLHFTYPPYSFVSKLSIPTVITTHGLSSINVKGSRSKRNYLNFRFILDPYFEKKALSDADRIITVSEYMKNRVDKILGMNSKTVYIPNGVDCNKYNYIENSYKRNHFSIFYLGRLLKIKGLDILIKALPIVKKSIPDIHLYVAGNGSQCEKIRVLVRELGLERNVTFLGFIYSEREKIDTLKSMDIFAIPSRFESSSIVLIEALAAGIPVVATNVGGMPEILDYGKYGILVEPDNPVRLAEGIIKLLDNPELRRKLSEDGKERVKDYSWDKITKKTIEVYHSII
ncbi:glycosyltransferase family 4 protein [Methanosarcina mazei]|uniref:Glycosyltransferase n=1 Tax=Methanosarcina mazei LYC TaxID=1434114 RepID=A0A0E3RQR9_METMZ|nr:glycosyltransferase family 4 protein [Methanosarcina mazei]AKB69079.1 Glycosyltransferase [Methanosarcina mazei LYC]